MAPPPITKQSPAQAASADARSPKTSAPGAERRVAAQDEVAAVGQRAEAVRQRLVRLAAHHDRVAARQLAEAAQVGGQVPGEVSVAADDAVAGVGDDAGDHVSTGMPLMRGVRVVVGQLEVLGAEVVDVGDRACPASVSDSVGRRRGSRESISSTASSWLT